MFNVTHLLETKKGFAFLHLQEQFWLQIIDESLTYTQGSVSKASELLGVSNATFRKWCDYLGVNLKPYRDLKALGKKDEMIKALAKYEDVGLAAAKVGLKKSTFRDYMLVLGIKNPKYRKLTKQQIEQAIPLFDKAYMVADYLGVHPTTLARQMDIMKINNPWKKK